MREGVQPPIQEGGQPQDTGRREGDGERGRLLPEARCQGLRLPQSLKQAGREARSSFGHGNGCWVATTDQPEKQRADPDLTAVYPLRTFQLAGSAEFRLECAASCPTQAPGTGAGTSAHWVALRGQIGGGGGAEAGENTRSWGPRKESWGSPGGPPGFPRRPVNLEQGSPISLQAPSQPGPRAGILR